MKYEELGASADHLMTPSETTPDLRPSSSYSDSSPSSNTTTTTTTATSTSERDSGEGLKNMNNKKKKNKKRMIPARNGGSITYRVRDHVRMGAKLSETVKGKLRLGAKIIKKGGRENIFKEIFGEVEGEKLLKASTCYISTTAGPIAGILFISTQKVAFCSETNSVNFPSDPSGTNFIKKPYKVLIPIEKIKRASRSENVDNPMQKYIEIVTEDNYEFWFMGFVRYEKALLNLETALSSLQLK